MERYRFAFVLWERCRRMGSEDVKERLKRVVKDNLVVLPGVNRSKLGGSF